jgi:hypothetical protein
MALLSDKKRLKREQEECQLAWNLLKTVPEYIKNYKQTVKLKERKSKSNLQKIKELEEKWGFGTLENPEEEWPSFEFLNFFSDYNSEVSRNNRTVDFGGIEHFHKKDGVVYDPNDNPCKDLMTPSEVTVKIDIEAPIRVIIKELESNIKHIKALFDIPKRNTLSHNHLAFLVDTLQRVGLNKSEIIDRLTPDKLKKPPYKISLKKAIIKKITRCFK